MDWRAENGKARLSPSLFNSSSLPGHVLLVPGHGPGDPTECRGGEGRGPQACSCER